MSDQNKGFMAQKEFNQRLNEESLEPGDYCSEGELSPNSHRLNIKTKSGGCVVTVSNVTNPAGLQRLIYQLTK